MDGAAQSEVGGSWAIQAVPTVLVRIKPKWNKNLACRFEVPVLRHSAPGRAGKSRAAKLPRSFVKGDFSSLRRITPFAVIKVWGEICRYMNQLTVPVARCDLREIPGGRPDRKIASCYSMIYRQTCGRKYSDISATHEGEIQGKDNRRLLARVSSEIPTSDP